MDNGKIMLVFVETGQKRKSVSGYIRAYKETRKKVDDNRKIEHFTKRGDNDSKRASDHAGI